MKESRTACAAATGATRIELRQDAGGPHCSRCSLGPIQGLSDSGAGGLWFATQQDSNGLMEGSRLLALVKPACLCLAIPLGVAETGAAGGIGIVLLHGKTACRASMPGLPRRSRRRAIRWSCRRCAGPKIACSMSRVRIECARLMPPSTGSGLAAQRQSWSVAPARARLLPSTMEQLTLGWPVSGDCLAGDFAVGLCRRHLAQAPDCSNDSHEAAGPL